jgi:hypothetical protein
MFAVVHGGKGSRVDHRVELGAFENSLHKAEVGDVDLR